MLVNNFDKHMRAGLSVRLVAFLIDGFIGPFMAVFISWIMINECGVSSVRVIILSMLLSIAYKPLMERYFGTTIGKMVMRLVVCDGHGGYINMYQAFGRNLLFCVVIIYNVIVDSPMGVIDIPILSMIPCNNDILYWLLWIDYLFVLLTPWTRTLHDMFSGTYCVYKNRMIRSDKTTQVGEQVPTES